MSSSFQEPGESPDRLQQELEQRLSAIRPTDTVRGFLINSVLKVVQEEGDEAMARRCLQVVGQERFLTFFSYPASTLVRLLFVVAGELGGAKGGFTEAMHYLGGAMSPEFLGSATGRSLLLLSGNSVKRMLGTIPLAFKSAINHGECSVEWMGLHGGRLIIKGNAIPCVYFEGSLRKTLDLSRQSNVSVLGRQLRLLDYELEVTWK